MLTRTASPIGNYIEGHCLFGEGPFRLLARASPRTVEDATGVLVGRFCFCELTGLLTLLLALLSSFAISCFSFSLWALCASSAFNFGSGFPLHPWPCKGHRC